MQWIGFTNWTLSSSSLRRAVFPPLCVELAIRAGVLARVAPVFLTDS